MLGSPTCRRRVGASESLSNLPKVAEAVANSGLRVGSSGLKAHPQSHAVPGVAECETLLAMEGTLQSEKEEGEGSGGEEQRVWHWKICVAVPRGQVEFASEVQRRQWGQGRVWERLGRDRCCDRRGTSGSLPWRTTCLLGKIV